MEIVHSPNQLEKYINEAVVVSGSSPVLIDSYLRDAIEVDIDALSDGKDVYIAGILEHIEEAGVHSGDSACSMPPFSLKEETQLKLKENIVNSTAGLGFINDLTTRTFTWKKQKDLPTNFLAYRAEPHEDANKYLNGDSDQTCLGFIAQEVKTVIDNHSEIPEGFPMWMEGVHESKEQLIAPSALIPILTKAIQELSIKNDSLETSNTALAARITTLENA